MCVIFHLQIEYHQGPGSCKLPAFRCYLEEQRSDRLMVWVHNSSNEYSSSCLVYAGTEDIKMKDAKFLSLKVDFFGKVDFPNDWIWWVLKGVKGHGHYSILLQNCMVVF